MDESENYIELLSGVFAFHITHLFKFFLNSIPMFWVWSAWSAVSKDGGRVLLIAYMSSVHCLMQILAAFFFIFWCLRVSCLYLVILFCFVLYIYFCTKFMIFMCTNVFVVRFS